VPSPGELRKILIALGIMRSPHVLIFDEPTNHLDLPSIECLEEALADCSCSMLLVSHDDVFLRHLVRVRWDIREGTLSIRDWHGGEQIVPGVSDDGMGA
jgi:ATPase subunit of ABC transporter with duplicated ATPase domains